MAGPGLDSAISTWSVPQCPFTIEYSPRVLDDIRLAVVDAFFSLPRGGAEIGGILLGIYEEGRLRVTEYAPLECEHAHGPSFTLSPPDLDRLRNLIAAAPANFPGCQVAGWYHSHTRSEIFLSEADLEIHARFFPQPWQVALVMKPHTFQPARAGFFFRERGGAIHASESYLEIALEAQAVRPAPALPEYAAAARIPQITDALPPVETQRPADVVLPVRFERSPMPAPPLPDPPPAVRAPMAAAPVVPAPAEVKPELHPQPGPQPPEKPAPVPGFAVQPAPRSRGWLKLVVAGLMLGAAAGVAYMTQQEWLPKLIGAAAPPAPAPSLSLHALDLEGQLQISWDRTAAAVRKSTDGIMEIKDGDTAPQRIPLDAAHLANGIFAYLRQSDRVDLKLILRQASGAPVSEVTTFLGKLPEKAAPDAGAELQRRRDEAAKLQTDLTNQAARTRKLEKEVQSMRNDMRTEQRRRLANQIPDSGKK